MVRTGPLVGLIMQLGLLAVLAATVGLGAAGWLAGAGYGLVMYAALSSGLRRRRARELGPAGRVTLVRAALVGGVAAVAADSFGQAVPVAVTVVLAAVALGLDAVDGHVARRTATVSALGARFDMEVDASLILVLSILVARSVGGWVLAIGLLRYAFVAAGWVLPWLRRPAPPRYWRKIVAVVQAVVLMVAAAGMLPPVATAVALAVSLGLLTASFGQEIGWLWRHRPVRPAVAGVGLGGEI